MDRRTHLAMLAGGIAVVDTTDQRDWRLPTPHDESEEDEYGEILNRAIDDDIEPDVVEALESGGGQLDEARERYDDSKQGPVAAYQRAGGGQLRQLRHTQQIVGTRRMAAHWPLVDPQFRDETFTYQNSGVEERVRLVNYSFLEQPPNMVPVLRAQCVGKSTTTGETFSVGIRHKTQPSGNWLLEFDMDGNGGALYDELYLHEARNGSAGRGPDTLTDSQIEVHAGIGTGSTTGQLSGSSSLLLDWEVV